MVRKLLVLLFSLMLIFCMNSSVFAAKGVEMTEDIASALLLYISENVDNLPLYGSNSNKINTAKNIALNFNPTDFANYFNQKLPEIENFTEYDWVNITCYFSYNSTGVCLKFHISNNSASDTLGYQYAYKRYSAGYYYFEQGIDTSANSEYGGLGYSFGFYIKSDGTFEDSNSLYSNTLKQSPPEILVISGDVLYCPFQVALRGIQDCAVGETITSTNIKIIGNVLDYEWDDYPEIPPSESGDTPSGDTGGGTVTPNPSGDTPGTTTPNYNEKLDNIQSGINNVNQNLDNISGELNEVNNNLTTVPELSGEVLNSGDIVGALGFDFAEDPYSNFWLELTTGLGNAFTDEIRSIDVQFRENTHKINLDDFSIQLPGVLKVFLTTTSTVFICWKMLKYWKIIIDNITSGNMDEVLSMNEEERYY